ncbi:LysR family transcriptional regulator [Catenovulum maritimum]|uniref:LysR family transcriptional regulator n=1 Tax=Catenovulum maritimum TaxID=1513271 RepID=A0A0J8GW74_9ALTE|nr:LysR family transcriptional regulator [Catenovulum maritimum]KMT64948.1 LysR family transcriptional regulator [Catenovulum maritimum]
MDSFDGIIEFVAVAETQSFSAAAKQLGCSTSHVSRQIVRLEERLGCVLLARTTRVVTLTKSGTSYYKQAKDLVVGLQQANEQVNQQQLRLCGTLKVSAAGGFAEHYVAPALMDFLAQHPDLSIELDLNSRLVNLLEEGFDFSIRYGKLDDSSLIARKLASRPMMAVAHPDYLNQRGIPKHPNQLKDHSCIVANNDNWEFNIDGQKQIVKVKGAWRSNNANLVLDACTKALGIAYMPKSTFKDAISNQILVPVLEPFWGEGTSSWIVYPNKRFMPQRVRLAIDFLIEHFSQWDEAG